MLAQNYNVISLAKIIVLSGLDSFWGAPGENHFLGFQASKGHTLSLMHFLHL
jgi:hypothetical protein